LLSAESKWKSEKTIANVKKPETEGIDEEFADKVNKYDLGLSFGFGFVHYFDPHTYRKRRGKKQTPVVQVDFKYNLGLMAIDPTKNIPDMNLRNHVFTIGLSITAVKN